MRHRIKRLTAWGTLAAVAALGAVVLGALGYSTKGRKCLPAHPQHVQTPRK